MHFFSLLPTPEVWTWDVDLGVVVAMFKPGREGPDTCRDNHPEPWHSGPTENQLWNSIPLNVLLGEEN